MLSPFSPTLWLIQFLNPIGSSTTTGNQQSQSCSTATVTGLIVFEGFAYLWMSQVTANIALATLAGGPFGSWYYFGPKGACASPPRIYFPTTK
jgi:hypothetical protein